MQRLREGIQVQVRAEAAQGEGSRRRAQLREASIPLRALRQGAEDSERTRDPQPLAHRREAVHLRGVWQVFRLRNPS